VVDLALRDSSGLELVKALRIQCPEVKVLVFTSDQVVSPAGEDDEPVQPPLETTTTVGTGPGSGTTSSP